METFRRTRMRDDLAGLKDIAEKYNVALLLIGRPLHMSGDESRQSEYTDEFAGRLQEYLGLPIVWWDERLTSAEAERMLRESGASLDAKRRAVDRLAAVLLLESYLENQRLMRAQEVDLA